MLAVFLYNTGGREIGESGAWVQPHGYIHANYPRVKKVPGKFSVLGEWLQGESSRSFIANYPSKFDHIVGGVAGGFLLPELGCRKIAGQLAGEELSFVINFTESNDRDSEQLEPV